MIPPLDTPREKARLWELLSYDILDSEAEEDFDNLTQLASEICGTKISLISLLDDKRQWFKSKIGLEVDETPKEFSFCGHAIHDPQEIFIIRNAREDSRFHDNPLVINAPYISFYAGVPLLSSSGHPLGTLCVIDDTPKSLSEAQVKALKALTKQIMNLIELRKKSRELESINQSLIQKNKEIERFAYLAAHDLKSPLKSNRMVIENLLAHQTISKDPEAKLMLEMLDGSSTYLGKLIDGLLEFSMADKISSIQFSEISPQDILREITSNLVYEEALQLEIETKINKLYINLPAVSSVLQNLISNSIKYSDKPETWVRVWILEDDSDYHFLVQDNGPGISLEYQERIFEPFCTLDSKDKYGNKATGLGLAYVKKLVEKLGGQITLVSELGKGVTYNFHVKKY